MQYTVDLKHILECLKNGRLPYNPESIPIEAVDSCGTKHKALLALGVNLKYCAEVQFVFHTVTIFQEVATSRFFELRVCDEGKTILQIRSNEGTVAIPADDMANAVSFYTMTILVKDRPYTKQELSHY